MTDTSKWKGAWLARCNVAGGGSYYRSHESKADALRGLKRQIKEDWSGLFDLDAAFRKGVEVGVYKDGGTDSWSDDEFVETATLY